MKSKLATMLAALAFAVPCVSIAQGEYPNRIVRIIVPQNPGGTTDVLARVISEKLTAKWGQTVLVDYKAGAGGNIGADFVAKSPADGYTLLMGYVGTQAVNAAVYKSLSYDPEKDFVGAASVATIPFMTVVNQKVPARSMEELVSLAKTQGLNYATSGNGSLNHLMGEILNNTANIKITHVPYRGIAQAVTGTIAGEIQVLHVAVPSVIQHVRSGAVRPIAVTSERRVDALRDVPTMKEAGFPQLTFESWFGLFAPAATPAAVVEKISRDVNEVLGMPDVVAKFGTAGADPLRLPVADFNALVRADTEKWGKVARASGAKAD